MEEWFEIGFVPPGESDVERVTGRQFFKHAAWLK
jgi:hypothetical protein